MLRSSVTLLFFLKVQQKDWWPAGSLTAGLRFYTLLPTVAAESLTCIAVTHCVPWVGKSSNWEWSGICDLNSCPLEQHTLSPWTAEQGRSLVALHTLRLLQASFSSIHIFSSEVLKIPQCKDDSGIEEFLAFTTCQESFTSMDPRKSYSPSRCMPGSWMVTFLSSENLPVSHFEVFCYPSPSYLILEVLLHLTVFRKIKA